MKEKAHSINHGFDGGCHGVTISSGVPAASHGSQLLLAFTAATQRDPHGPTAQPHSIKETSGDQLQVARDKVEQSYGTAALWKSYKKGAKQTQSAPFI